jgi:hypothetical protein
MKPLKLKARPSPPPSKSVVLAVEKTASELLSGINYKAAFWENSEVVLSLDSVVVLY